jgi:hypothetical protein
MYPTERTALVALRHAAVVGLLSAGALAYSGEGSPSRTVDQGGAAGQVPVATRGSGGAGDGEWIPLFNGTDLEGWTVSPGAEALFGVGTIDGGRAMHVYPTQPDQSDQPSATIRTNESYSSYVFHMEYKWGEKRYSNRKQTDKDSGICFHLCGDFDQVWPESLEFQIGSQDWPGDWVTGNIFMLINKTRAQWSYTIQDGQEVFSEGGTMKSIGAPARYYKALAPEQLDDEEGWNVLELTVHGSESAEYSVNGTIVNALYDFECNVSGNWEPLDSGPIALQAEWADLYFRDVKIKLLD